MNQTFNRNPAPPPDRFQRRLRFELGYISQAQVGQHCHRLGHADDLLERRMIEDADPTHSDPLSPSSQPEILDGATGAVQIRRTDRCTAEHMLPATPSATRHTEVDRCFFDAFQLQTPIELTFGTRVHRSGVSVGLLEQFFHRALCRAIADHHKIPWLHEPHRTCMMRRRQETQQHVILNRRPKKISPHVATLKNRAIHGFPFWMRKSAILLFHSIIHPIPQRDSKRDRTGPTRPWRLVPNTQDINNPDTSTQSSPSELR